MPMLPWPLWPLAGHAILGQHVVVGSMLVSSASRWGTYQEEYAWTPIVIASAPYHGEVWSYPTRFVEENPLFLLAKGAEKNIKNAFFLTHSTRMRWYSPVYVKQFCRC